METILQTDVRSPRELLAHHARHPRRDTAKVVLLGCLTLHPCDKYGPYTPATRSKVDYRHGTEQLIEDLTQPRPEELTLEAFYREARELKLEHELMAYKIAKRNQGIAIPFSFGVYECKYQQGGEWKKFGLCHVTEYVDHDQSFLDYVRSPPDWVRTLQKKIPRLLPGNMCGDLCKLLKPPGSPLKGMIDLTDVVMYTDYGNPQARAVWVNPTVLDTTFIASPAEPAVNWIWTITQFREYFKDPRVDEAWNGKSL
ncbi:hypothetical protein GLOTRDRAFT_94933 [Gloeophyllum trabeum ATCC 11539]|uniref:Uncharacterized protein n=1 Tax=Gloeophyllum trabeum (strain ATCC 11539 / FP-39264 / Madison 617) TaxID=670483 RepID=S7Q2K1_GLOTA|nr:uncharacterized protein GLOTRDRAFT_94933 [Gloeophyllum trabeum ATCC 11539]EPQ53777.1 hypothetical protein GLOTRDRAFT_94933 [Gloeophyllum trabeum ATCC 11539]